MMNQQELRAVLGSGFDRGLTRIYGGTDPLDWRSRVHLKTVAGSRRIGNPIDLQVLVKEFDDFVKIRHVASVF
jgi:hypothetical protein